MKKIIFTCLLLLSFSSLADYKSGSTPRIFLIDDLKYLSQCYQLSDIEELQIAIKRKDTRLYKSLIKRNACFTAFSDRSILEELNLNGESICKYRVHSIFNTKKLTSYSLGSCKTDLELKNIRKSIMKKIEELNLNK